MNFVWTDEQLTYREAAIKFARQALNGDLIERDQQERFSRDTWMRCAEFGIQGLPMPEACGGTNAGILTTMATMEGLGYGCRDNGLIFGLNAQLWGVQLPILSFGTGSSPWTTPCAGPSPKQCAPWAEPAPSTRPWSRR